MQFLFPPSINVESNPFNTSQAFCDLKALYESEINSPALTKKSSSSHSNSNPTSLGPKPRRTRTGPANGYPEQLNAIEQYVFNEPLINLFANTRIRASSLDQRSIDDLAHSYKLRYVLKDVKRKCDINLQGVLEDLKRLYSSQDEENIKTLLTCMTQLAAAYMLSSLAELKNGKCKHILEKLSDLEQMVYKYLQAISAQCNNALSSQDVEDTELTLVQTNSNPRDSLGSGDPQRLSIPQPTNNGGTGKLHYMTPRNTKKAERILNDKLSHKEALKILARMKYVIAQWGRLLHYESIANSVMKSVNKEETSGNKEQLLSPLRKKERKFFDEDPNEEAIALKKKHLQKFWEWKIFKWKLSEPMAAAQEKKEIYQILCPICEKNVKLDQGKQHLELCKEKAELNNRLCDLDNKLGDVVFQAFKKMKTIQKSLCVDSKKYSKLYAEFNNKTPNQRTPGVSQGIQETSNECELLISKCRSEETKQAKIVTTQLSGEFQSLQELDKDFKVETALQLNLDNLETVEQNPFSLPEEKSFALDFNDESDPEKTNPIFKLLKVNTTFERLPEKERDETNRRFSLRAHASEDNLESASSGIDATFSALILPDSGLDSPAANDSYSVGTPEFERRSSRSKSLVSDLNGNLFYKKSRFCTIKEIQDHNTSIQEHDAEDEIAPQSGASLGNSSAGLFRKSRTITKKLEQEDSVLLKRETKLLKNGQNIVECLKEMKAAMTLKKLKMKIYELIQKKGKVMLNQQPYHKEMDFLKEEISNSIQELREKTHCNEACDFAEEFIKILEKRIESGRLLYKAEKKLCKLEGKPKKRNSIKLEPLIRHKSGLPPDTNKLFKVSNGDTIEGSSIRFNWDPKATGKKFTLVKQSSNKEEEVKSNGLKVKISPPNEEYKNNSLLVQSALADPSGKTLGHYLYSLKDTEEGNDQEIEDTVGSVRGSKSSIPSSLLPSSISEMHEFKQWDDISAGNTCLSQMLSEDMKKSSLATFKNTDTQPSIVVNDMPLSFIPKVRQKTVNFASDANKELQFGKRDNQRALTTPSQLKTLGEINGNAAADTAEIFGSSLFSLNESSIILDYHSPNIQNGKFEFNGTLMKPEEIKEEEEEKRESNKNYEEDLQLQKKSGKMVKFGAYLTQKTISSKNLDSSGSIDSVSSVESTINERGYFSDSEARNPNRSLQSHTSVRIEDFEAIKMISKGAFGRVWLVRKKATKDVYAMKVINLAEKLMKNKDLENLRKESNVFSIAQEEFLVRAVFTFTHETCICFVMEYMVGGDLGDLLFNYGALEEDVARFYIAELILAVEYLHSVGIVHRDLKPDNILLDKSGHSKLTDFGLSEVGLSQKMKSVTSPIKPLPASKFWNFRSSMARKLEELINEKDELIEPPNLTFQSIRHENKEDGDVKEGISRASSYEKNRRKVNRLIGTPDYMAPEIINNVTITSPTSDWWSVGVILFELIVGVPPFNDDSPDKIFQNILGMKVPWDDIQIGYGEGMVTPEAEDLIKKLLNPDHLLRLGAFGATEIKTHPFFKNINWATLRSQKAPITFDDANDTDTQNFVRMQDQITAKENSDPFALIHKDGDIEVNTQTAKQFLQTSQENFRMVNISALYSAGLKLTEETMKEKEKELNQAKPKENPKRTGSGKFSDVFDAPE